MRFIGHRPVPPMSLQSDCSKQPGCSKAKNLRETSANSVGAVPPCRPAVVGSAVGSYTRGRPDENHPAVEGVPRTPFRLIAATTAGRDRAAAPTASFGFLRTDRFAPGDQGSLLT